VAKRNLERAKLFPGVTLGFDYKIRQSIPGKDKGDDFISLKASIPIPVYFFLKEKNRIKAAINMEKVLKKILEDVKNSLTSSWSGTNSKHNKLLVVYLDFERAILPGYKAVYESQIAALASGSVTLLDVLDAYRLLLNTSLERARIYRDLMISKSKLNYLLYSFSKIDEKNRNSMEK
ncbi:TolC family protein, partial [Spirochaetota bacterium]